ncbi:MAG: hypothetical protein GXO82_07410, partial [Chlorobi bacterium]|nr:hypothetical protein [Chlorobiota bacterium]
MKSILFFCAVVLLSSYCTTNAQSNDPTRDKCKPLTTQVINDHYDFISINNILMWMGNNGDMAFNPITNEAGLEWPKGSGKYLVMKDGFVIGGKIDGKIRIAGSTYRQGFQAGKILPDGTPDDPSLSRYRIYKVRKIRSSQYYQMSAEEQERLARDFKEWPAEDGAPYTDRNNNGRYDPDFTAWLDNWDNSDEPFIVGNEVLWFVMNDMDSLRSMRLYGTPPIGLEVQVLVWGYDNYGPLGNTVFVKYTIINKGGENLTDAYFAKWSDIDVGNPDDDLVGVDTLLNLGYGYNFNVNDGVYKISPAVGYDFLQGPVVPQPGATAKYNFGDRTGYRNLPMTSFIFYIGGDPIYMSAPLGDGYVQMYNNLLGKMWNGTYPHDPITNQPTKFLCAGDPITGRGWVDGRTTMPSDRTILPSSGPFTLAVGDTQEVVVGTIVARGADRLNSVQMLRYYDRFIQVAFNYNFDLPRSPPTPVVRTTILPNKIVLYWGDQKQVDRIEKYHNRGYKFQGYNIYQFPNRDAFFEGGKRLATYDVVDNVAT